MLGSRLLDAASAPGPRNRRPRPASACGVCVCACVSAACAVSPPRPRLHRLHRLGHSAAAPRQSPPATQCSAVQCSAVQRPPHRKSRQLLPPSRVCPRLALAPAAARHHHTRHGRRRTARQMTDRRLSAGPSPRIPPAPPPPPPKQKPRSYFERFVAQPLTTYASRPSSVQTNRPDGGPPNPLVPRLPGCVAVSSSPLAAPAAALSCLHAHSPSLCQSPCLFNASSRCPSAPLPLLALSSLSLFPSVASCRVASPLVPAPSV
jgi:hypothetical protein